MSDETFQAIKRHMSESMEHGTAEAPANEAN